MSGGASENERSGDSPPGAPVDLEALDTAYEAGLNAERAGDMAAAGEAFRRCLALDPEDRGGASVRLAALGQGTAPDRAPPAYVALLFDQHADSFETTLVHNLGYVIPDRIAERLVERGDGPFARGVDLGCGTGLVGEALAEIAPGLVAALDGLDLAEGMLAVAEEKDAYAGLYVGDAVAFLEQAAPGAYDLAIAADVLPYLGALEPLAAALAHALAPGGLAVMSTETLPDAAFAGRAWAVGPRHRFAHRLEALTACLAAAGLETVEAVPETIRYETGVPVPGHLVLARRR
ncbi:MAG: methyltransferase [Pseudomonadota bacterium]